jgi:CrcB protein
MIWLGVAATSALGAASRYGLMAGFERRFDRGIPWGTVVVNLTGSVALGLLAGADPSDATLRLVGGGFLGSFTTFSTWMVEGAFILGSGTRRRALQTIWWVAGMLALGVVAFGAGVALAR